MEITQLSGVVNYTAFIEYLKATLDFADSSETLMAIPPPYVGGSNISRAAKESVTYVTEEEKEASHVPPSAVATARKVSVALGRCKHIIRRGEKMVSSFTVIL